MQQMAAITAAKVASMDGTTAMNMVAIKEMALKLVMVLLGSQMASTVIEDIWVKEEAVVKAALLAMVMRTTLMGKMLETGVAEMDMKILVQATPDEDPMVVLTIFKLLATLVPMVHMVALDNLVANVRVDKASLATMDLVVKILNLAYLATIMALAASIQLKVITATQGAIGKVAALKYQKKETNLAPRSLVNKAEDLLIVGLLAIGE
uniref:Uncharacterized protein n=1 Tax=Plectus sambesii TaxID=2011161 RepID=A0A914UKI5_9BILA